MKNWKYFTLVAIFTLKIIAVPFALLFPVACKNEPDAPPANKIPIAVPEITGTGVTFDAGAGVYKVSLEDISTRGITLRGTESNDPDAKPGETLEYAWVPVGTLPGTATITNPAGATTTITGIKKIGDYTFALTVKDKDGGVSVAKSVTLRVESYQVPDPVTLTFLGLVAGTTLDFNPTSLPAGVTYTIEDDNGHAPHVNGVVSASSYTPFSTVNFTQVFNANDEEVGRWVVKATVGGGSDFAALSTTPSSVTLSLKKTITELP